MRFCKQMRENDLTLKSARERLADDETHSPAKLLTSSSRTPKDGAAVDTGEVMLPAKHHVFRDLARSQSFYGPSRSPWGFRITQRGVEGGGKLAVERKGKKRKRKDNQRAPEVVADWKCGKTCIEKRWSRWKRICEQFENEYDNEKEKVYPKNNNLICWNTCSMINIFCNY